MPEKKKNKKNHCCFNRFKKNKTTKRIQLEWCELDLTSKLVLIIGAILLLQLILSIFLHESHEDSSINIVFRTALSSVMGYILGGMNTPPNKTLTPTLPQPTLANKDSDTNQLSHFDDNHSCEADRINLQSAKNIRALAAATVCLICISTLFIACSFNIVEYKEGLIQMRDLISTTIGYLIAKSSTN